jgi:hypothetical protein
MSFKKNEKNSKKISKIISKNCDFLKYFLPILYNIGLYIYTVKYKSGIKIPGFFWNISKKKIKTFSKKSQKTFKSISLLKKKTKIFCFHTAKSYKFSKHVFIKRLHLFHALKIQKMDIITSLWSSIRVWPKYQKSFSNLFFLGSRCRL